MHRYTESTAIKNKSKIQRKTVRTSNPDHFFRCFALFSPSRSTTVRLRGEENVILYLSQQPDSLSKILFRQSVSTFIKRVPLFLFFLFFKKGAIFRHTAFIALRSPCNTHSSAVKNCSMTEIVAFCGRKNFSQLHFNLEGVL